MAAAFRPARIEFVAVVSSVSLVPSEIVPQHKIDVRALLARFLLSILLVAALILDFVVE